MKIDRRDFLQTIFGAAALTALSPSVGAARAAADEPPLCFSTVGCPDWNWAQILDAAKRFGYRGVTVRGIEREMDLTKRPEFSAARVRESLRAAKKHRVRVVSLGASTRLHDYDQTKRAKEIDEAKRFIDLAHELKASFVRVFGDEFLPRQKREATIERVAAGLRELGAYAKGSNVTVILESHGAMTDSKTLGAIFAQSEMPNVGFQWDVGHTFMKGGEQPAETYAALGKYVRFVELRDAVPAGADKIKTVMIGDGIVPVRDAVRVLAQNDYKGFYSFEWLKFYEPDIAEPDIGLQKFPIIMRDYFAAAKKKSATEKRPAAK